MGTHRTQHVTSYLGGVDTGGTCSPEGEMLWRKSADGKNDRYEVCYGPAFRNHAFGPSGGHLTCDQGTYLSLTAPKFCCKNPRQTIQGQSLHAKEDLCGDILAKFDPGDQKIRWLRGPETDAPPRQRSLLQFAGLGDAIPSPIAFQALKDGSEWKLLLGQRCKGRDGTLITWPTGRAELCPTGSQPVQGRDYASWQCDGFYAEEREVHCCEIRGKMRCVPHLSDQSSNGGCTCPGLGGVGEGEDRNLQELLHNSSLPPALLVPTLLPAHESALPVGDPLSSGSPCHSWARAARAVRTSERHASQQQRQLVGSVSRRHLGQRFL